MESRGPIEAGLGWCCKEDTGFIGSGAVRAAREAGPAERLVPFTLTGSGIARQGNPVVGGGEVTSGTLSPSLGIGIGMAYLPAARAVTGEAIEIDVRGQRAPRGRGREAALPAAHGVGSADFGPAPTQGDEMADASYPTDLLYHPEHDWARIEGDVATLGITWFAQDALGEVVFFDPPEVGATTTAGESYAEVESVKAVSDVIAPLSGEIVEVNDALGDGPEAINDDPYGEGWMVKVRLTDVSEKDALLDAATYEASLLTSKDHVSRYTATPEDLQAMLDAIGASSSRSCSTRSPTACGCAASSTCPRGCPSRTSTRTCSTSRAATRPPRTR